MILRNEFMQKRPFYVFEPYGAWTGNINASIKHVVPTELIGLVVVKGYKGMVTQKHTTL